MDSPATVKEGGIFVVSSWATSSAASSWKVMVANRGMLRMDTMLEVSRSQTSVPLPVMMSSRALKSVMVVKHQHRHHEHM